MENDNTQEYSDTPNTPTGRKSLLHYIRKQMVRLRTYINTHWGVVYLAIIGVFVVFFLLLGSNNIFVQIRLSHRIRKVERRIAVSEKKYQADKAYLDERKANNALDVEALARKDFRMKEEGEMRFLLIDTTSNDFKFPQAK